MKLKEYRKKHDFTQEEIANYLGVSKSVYCRYEKELRRISVVDVKKLATLYRVNIENLLDDPIEKKEETKRNINEERLLVAFRRMNPANQNSLITFAEYSVSQQQKLDQNKQVK